MKNRQFRRVKEKIKFCSNKKIDFGRDQIVLRKN